MNILTQKDIDRFWGKVDKEKSTNFYNGTKCWVWVAACNSGGYGHINYILKTEYSHRISWFLSHGEIPDNLRVLHHCDNPPCVNPDHLFLGTLKDNSQDRERKGRGNHATGEKSGARTHPETHARGEKHGSAKLTWGQVREIRQRYKRLGIGGDNSETLAKEFGVVSRTILSIVHNEIWKE